MSRLVGVVLGGVVTLVAVNGLGYLLAGRGPGYNHAQGGANLWFLISIMISPLGMIEGMRLGRRLTGQRKPMEDRRDPLH